MRIHRISLVALLVVAGALLPPRAWADATDDGISDFKKALTAEAWKDRAEAYTALAFFDGAKIVDVILKAVAAEQHGAVQVRGLMTLGRLETEEAHAALLKAAVKGKGTQRAFAIVAMQWQQGTYGSDALIKLLADKSGQVAGLTALALGKRQIPDAIEPLAKLLAHSQWQVRAAAARGLHLMAGDKPVKKFDKHGNHVPDKNPKPWVPKFYDIKKVLPALVQALDKGVGSERLAIIDCLERLTKQEYGWDVRAWKMLAAGADPEQIQGRPKYPPMLMGVPLFGQRVVVIYDRSQPTDDPHPWTDPARLKELCKVPGGPPVPWLKIKKRSHFMAAHTKRWVSKLPKGVKFDIVFMGGDLNQVFGKLSSSAAGNKKKAIEAVDEVKLINGSDSWGALHAALDIAGTKESQAWKKGPDEIVFMSCGVPWQAKVTDQDSIGGALSIKALMRLVPIHTVGVGLHPYGMMREMSKHSGGRYVNLQK